ncbi:MAG: 3-deoxy-manno-octulosonate cytidylyltransferase, partial [Rhodocyclaceae bacterium]|nr:3-deoxy-manno-octulosonate cytidylyltransferase [Rhodocyclaceae bacterium]
IGEMKTCVIIPARYSSSRFPGKPLALLLGKPMVLWCAELAAKAVGRDHTYVATEDDRIKAVVESAGFNAVMTSKAALTGTDRLAEAADLLDYDIYINVQGDEPLVNPADILAVEKKKKGAMNCIVNGYCWISPDEDPHSVNIPKVVSTEGGRLLYMSRAAVPAFKDPACAPKQFKKQVCIYAFTRDELKAYKAFGRKSEVEFSEDIEILRFFEIGKEIMMVQTEPGSLAVDVPEDIPGVEAALQKLHCL